MVTIGFLPLVPPRNPYEGTFWQTPMTSKQEGNKSHFQAVSRKQKLNQFLYKIELVPIRDNLWGLV